MAQPPLAFTKKKKKKKNAHLNSKVSPKIMKMMMEQMKDRKYGYLNIPNGVTQMYLGYTFPFHNYKLNNIKVINLTIVFIIARRG